jgi:hypothetical protein
MTHGGIHLSGDRVLATTGDGPLRVFDATTGKELARHDLQLDGNHVMEFAVDEPAQRVFVVGSCDYVRGLVSVDLRTGTTKVLAPPRRESSPCGERIAVTPDGRRLVLVQRTNRAEGASGLLRILSDTGAELLEIRKRSVPIDLLLLHAP